MKVQELPVKEWLAHLRRHPIPEIMDDICLDALKSVKAQYGEVISHGVGLEVRLGDEARYVDYIMNIDSDMLPSVESLWYEIDYEEFLRVARDGGTIEPCLFVNTGGDKAEEAGYWDKMLPAFLGEAPAVRLRPAFDRVLAPLPKGAFVKQIGTMTGRGEIDIMRLVIMFPNWEIAMAGLDAIRWPGDVEAFRRVTEPWKEVKNVALNFDVGVEGVLPKVGLEVFSRWRHPILVDKFVAKLEEAGLCLPSKAEALRRWVRLRPEGDPFIQTLISYFKLVYRDGRIVEAKAYLEQSPYVHHHYFDAYEQPARLDMELTDRYDNSMRESDAFARLLECTAAREQDKEQTGGMFESLRRRGNGVRQVRFIGGEEYEHLDRLLEHCREYGLRAEVVLAKNVRSTRLAEMIGAGADAFLVDVNAEDGSALQVLKTLYNMGFANVRARWRLHAGNLDKLERAVRLAERLGVTEFLVTGMRNCDVGDGREMPSRVQIEQAADFIRTYRGEATEEGSETEQTEKPRMELTVESCFSPLAAFLGGEDAAQNPNRGVARGCEAGRTFAAVRTDGAFSPCGCLAEREKADTLSAYWESSSMKAFRAADQPDDCMDCCYRRRCLPCPDVMEKDGCPVKH